jgi:hypothetical protein
MERKELTMETTETCSAAREWLSARRDGEHHEGAALARHLARCPDCRAFEGELDGLAQRFAALPPVDPPADLWARIEARLDAVGRRRPALALRVAAGLVGFLGVHLATGGAGPAPERGIHALARGLGAGGATDAREFLAGSPEYQLLRRLAPRPEGNR